MVSRIPQKFDAGASYEVMRTITLLGQNLQPGDAVPKIPTRRLEQLYDSRKVRISTAPQSGQAKKGKSKWQSQ